MPTHLALWLASILLTSCAWNKGEFTRWAKGDGQKQEKRLKEVGVKGEDLKKFSLQEEPALTPAPAPVPAPAAVAKPGPTPAVPQKVVRPAPVATPRPVPTPAAVKPKPPAPAVSAVPAAFAYPADYPEELKAVDEKARVVWEKFRPVFGANENHFLDIDYLGMTVGKVVMSYRGTKVMGGKEVYHFQARFKSAPFYSAMYELDDQIDAYVAKDGFRSLRSNLIQRESKQDVDEIQLFDREKLKTKAYQKRVRDGKTKQKEWKGWIPRYSVDSFSAIHIIRGLGLKPGDHYTLPIINKGEVLLMDLKAEARETIKTKRGERASLRVHAYTKYTGRTLKSGDMTLWLAETPARELLRMQAKIKIGSVYAELAEGE